MGKKSGSSAGTQTVTQKSDPWSGIQPGLLQAANQAQNLYNTGALNFQYYPGQTVAPQSQYTQQATNMLANRAMNGSPLVNSAQNQLQSTINGDYLDITKAPGFQSALDSITNAYQRGTAAQTDAAYNKAGAYGGSAYNELTGANNKAFADSLGNLAANNYNQARTQQLLAANQAPSIANNDYLNIAQLQNAGNIQDAYNQDLLNSNIDRFNFNQASPANALQNYVTLLQGTGGNLAQTQKSTPLYQNKVGNTLGLLGGLNQVVGGAGGSGGIFDTLGNIGSSAAKVAGK